MCKINHKELTSQALAELVSEGGGVKVVRCGDCGQKFVVSYGGPVGLFAEVREIGEG